MLLRKLFSMAKFYFKYIIFFTYIVLITTVMLPFCLLRPMNTVHSLLFAKISILMIPLIGLDYEVRGQEHLAQDRAGIIISNHQSSIDMIGMTRAWPILKKGVSVVKKLVFYGWPAGLTFWLCGFLYIEKKNWEKTSRILEDAIKVCKKNKVKVWIFPEGTRYHEGGIHDFKKGAFYMAIKQQLPILPVVISEYYFLSLKEKRFDSGKVIMTALPAISTKGLELKDMEELMTKTRLLMMKAYDSVNEELKESRKAS